MILETRQVMGRKALIWYQGAIYHITARGNHRNEIFKDREDYKVYFIILKEALEKYSAVLFCYCIMKNHVHLLIQTGDKKISLVMKRVNEFYTRYFNNKYILVGHLFQGRYYWKLIDNDKYLLDVSKYIHLNPVRAKIVEKPEDYELSSYAAIIGLKKENLTDFSRILQYYKSDNCRELYKEFVEEVTGTARKM